MANNSSTSGKWRKHHKSISWSSAGAESLKSAIVAVQSVGGAIMFATTMDEGALVCSVFVGQEKVKEYITEPGDIPAFLAWLCEEYK